MMNKQVKKVTLYSQSVDELPNTLCGLYSLFGGLLTEAGEYGTKAFVDVEPSDYEYGYSRMEVYYERPYTQEELEEEEARLKFLAEEREKRLVIDEKKMLERLKAKYEKSS